MSSEISLKSEVIFMMAYERIQKILEYKEISITSLAKKLKVSQSTFNGYFNEKRGNKILQHLWDVVELFPDVNRNWLFFGEGEMLGVPPLKQNANQAIPIQGFASCDVHGWHGAMSIQVTVSAPIWHDKILAVMASGESMLPAGIGNGQICYCDPTLEPIEGDAVFVEQAENLSTIKLFCEREERQGEEFIKLKGWLDKTNETTVQKDFYLSVLSSHIKRIAPVVYVRRRL